MGRTYWTIWGIVSAITSIFFFWAFGYIVPIITLIIIPAVHRGRHKVTLDAKIDLLAKQAGIQYGTTEEKLEQLAGVKQSTTTDTRDPWDRT